MGKLSLLGVETTFSLSDYVVKVKNAGAGDVIVTLANFLKAIAGLQEDWHAASYSNSWVDFDAGGAGNYGGVQYFKDSLGIVHMRGMAKSGTTTAGTTILTLPAGYLPGEKVLFVVNSNDTHAGVDVLTDGTIKTRAGISAAWVSFANISFRAEN